MIFIKIEKPNEIAKHDLKKEKTKEVNEAVDYLKKIFWQYATNEQRYNYTHAQFKAAVSVSSLINITIFFFIIHISFFSGLRRSGDTQALCHQV